MEPAPVPTLLITGPIGVGKSTVLLEAARQLRAAQRPHAAVDLDSIAEAWPPPVDDPWNERLTQRNLACMWANYRDAGAERLLLARVLEARSLLRYVTAAVPHADITVVRLRAPWEVVEARIRYRERGRDPSWFLEAAAYLVEAMEQSDSADSVIETADRPVGEVAGDVLHRAGWLS
jgi:ribose 1,5-bisphosphokinase PhnN